MTIRAAMERDDLAGAPLLRGASAAAVEQLRESARETRLAAREWLFRAGEPADRLFLVLSGRLRVVEPETGRLLREVGAGAALGELGLLTGSVRSASVRAVRDCRLLELDAEHFLRLVRDDGGFAVSIAQELARQLQASGGLELPEARPSVFGVVTADAEPRAADLPAFVAELERALGRFGSVARLDGSGLAPERFARALEEAEAQSGHVLLVAGAAGDWREFSRRQCDRLLVVAHGPPPAAAAELEGCELVLVGVSPAAVESWLEAASPRAHHIVPAGAGFSRGVERVARRLTRRSLGVVLSGGGARGFAHIGALAALAEAGFELDRIGGCSMGAFVAAMAAEGRDATELRDRCAQEFVRRSPFNDYTLPRVSLIRSRKAAAMLERVFGGDVIEALERPLFTVSADLLSSTVVVHRRGRIVDAVGASMSIPGVAPPVLRGGRLLVDGGVLNNLPVDHMAETGEGPVLAVDVIRRLEEADGEPTLPSIAETLARASVLGSVERAERNRALALVLVTPEVQAIGLREWAALDTAVAAGRRATTAALESGGAEKLRAALDAQV
ncbi:MAG TPA: patatin-like phospholipase family protein [Gaiellaceae bacterium]|nr:patatin-like phospholipase family protein [Gaiellaceae bacterium]